MQSNLFDLTGKTIIITGGAGHLGTAMSEALAAFGADLFVVGTSKQKNEEYAHFLQKKYAKIHCESLVMNVDSLKSIEDAFAYIYEKKRHLDVLINNAAYCAMGKVEDMTDDAWCRGIDGTINSTFRVTKVALRYMLPQGYGNIINIASMYGIVAPDPRIYGTSGYDNPASYGAGKAAIIQFTRYMAATYGNVGIRANAVSPGSFPNANVQKNIEFVKNLSAKNPMGRIGKPEDLQGIIVYLASDASSYLTGQNIAVDGGWTSW